MDNENAVLPKLGYTPEQWAYLLSQKLTHEQPKNAEAAKKIYAEVIGAAVRAEREACATVAEQWNEGYDHTGRDIAKHIRERALTPPPVVEVG